MATKQAEESVSVKYENGNITPSSTQNFTNDFCKSLQKDKANLTQSNLEKDKLINELIASNANKDNVIKEMQKSAGSIVGKANKK